MLKDQGIDRGEIVGFYSEEFTHWRSPPRSRAAWPMSAVGIEAAATRLGLEFIPMFTEDYYLLAKRESLEQKNIAELVEVLASPSFRSLVGGIPGYDASGAGTIKTIGEAA